MMKMMDRYIIREMIVPFVAGALVIALLFDANQLIYVLKTFTIQNVPGIAMLQVILLRTPYWLNITLPAGVSLAASLAITRMARESEIVALRACGVKMFRIVLPVAMFGFVVAIGNFFLVERVIPKAEAKAHSLELEIGMANAIPEFKTDIWVTLRDYHATFRKIHRNPDDSIDVEGIVLGQRKGDNSVSYTYADRATYRKPGIWTIPNPMVIGLTFKDGRVQVDPITPQPGKKSMLTINQPISIEGLFLQEQPENKSMAQLAEQIRAGKEAGRDMAAQEITLYERFSTPASCIIFAIVSPIFSVIFARTGSFMGLLLSFVIVLFYYNASVVSEVLGKNHILSPWLAAWLPNLIFIALGILGVRRLE